MIFDVRTIEHVYFLETRKALCCIRRDCFKYFSKIRKQKTKVIVLRPKTDESEIQEIVNKKKEKMFRHFLKTKKSEEVEETILFTYIINQPN